MKVLVKLGAIALVLVMAAAAQAQMVLAARVNGVGIGVELVDRQFEELLRERRLNIARMNNPAQARAIKREALDNLIRIELLSQEAQKAGLAVSEAEADRALANYRAQFRNQEGFLRRLEGQGFTEATFRVHLRKLLSADRYAQTVVEREVKVSDKDIEDFYEINPRLFKRSEQVRVRQILIAVAPDAGPEAKAKARARIDALAARTRAGESFEELARQNSDDATRQWGGEMDPFGRGQQNRAFEDAAFALQPGELSAPVETPQGLHLIRLEERLPAVATPLDQVRDKIRDQLRASRGKEAIAREVEQLRDLGDVKVLTPL
jgi:parvulin-like peptidyl-prolyl isomerase